MSVETLKTYKYEPTQVYGTNTSVAYSKICAGTRKIYYLMIFYRMLIKCKYKNYWTSIKG